MSGIEMKSMTEVINKPPHPWKRWCHNDHDTYDCGRYRVSRSCVKCIEEKNKAKSERDKAARRVRVRPVYCPEIKAVREKRSISLGEMVFESRLDRDTLWMIEEGYLAATYQERVAIFQALNVIAARRIEAREEEMEVGRRWFRAGMA